MSVAVGGVGNENEDEDAIVLGDRGRVVGMVIIVVVGVRRGAASRR